MSIVSTIKLSARQYMLLGEDPPGVRLELVDGEVAVSPSPNSDHSYTDTMLRIIVGSHIVKHDLGHLFGDVDTIFGEYDVRRPDQLFFQKSRLHLIGDNAMQGPPDLCIEIISPSSIVIDRRDKFAQYATGGVAHYWIVDPKLRTVEGFSLVSGEFIPTGSGKDSDLLHLPPFDSLELPLAQLWRPKNPAPAL